MLLNLFNNAFYAVHARALAEASAAADRRKTDLAFKPAVNVSTKKENGVVKISVKDNGAGIPKHAVDKIFQPFFTTKPTGQGTGLGLSLSYDIIKAHNGETFVFSTKSMISQPQVFISESIDINRLCGT